MEELTLQFFVIHFLGKWDDLLMNFLDLLLYEHGNYNNHLLKPNNTL